MFKRFMKSELGKGAIVLFITMNIFNFLNFVFHFTMGRLLGPADYGVLAVLMSLIYIYQVPVEALQNISSKYVSQFKIKSEFGKMKYIILKILKKSVSISFILFILCSLVSIYLSFFLEINFWLIFIGNLYLFFAFVNPILRGVLQGEKKFGLLGMSLITEAASKIILSAIFVFIGFKVFGAITGVIIGLVISLVFTILFNKSLLKTKSEKTQIKDAYSENISYFIAMLIIFVIFSLDILLAKRFFTAEIAGQYAVASMLGKMIFLGTVAISKAMFPLSCESNGDSKKSSKIFKKSLILLILLCIISVLAFAIIPKFIIWILYGSQYLIIAPYLVYSGLAFSFLSIGNLVLIQGLATNKLKRPYLLFVFIIITLVLLFLFHANLLEFVIAFMVSNLILLIGSLFTIFKKSSN